MSSYLSCVGFFINLVVAPCRSVLSAANQMVGRLFRMNVFAGGRNAIQSGIQWSAVSTFETIRPKLRAAAPLTGSEIRFMERQSSFELDALDRSQYGQWKQEQFDRLQKKIKEGELLTPFEDEEYEAFTETHIFNAHDQEVHRKWENQVEPVLERNLEKARQNKLRNIKLAKPRPEEEGIVKQPNLSKKVRIVEPMKSAAGGNLSAFLVPYGRQNG